MDDNRIVVLTLGILCGLCIVGIAAAPLVGHDPNPTLGTIASGIIGAIVCYLVPKPTRGSMPVPYPVPVENDAKRPV